MIKTLTTLYLALSLALTPVVGVFAGTASSCHPGGDSQQAPCPMKQSMSGGCCHPDTSPDAAFDRHPNQCQQDCTQGAFSMMLLPEPGLNLAAYTPLLIPFTPQSPKLSPVTPPYKPPRA